jgi:glycosyltransferase involved in cell wall biosynthesis
MNKTKIAVVCKLMPRYRLGVFQKLSSLKNEYEFAFFGDTKEQAGIENIDWKQTDPLTGERLRWIKTKNFFYRPELLLWQTGIINKILFSKYKVFIFEGGVSHIPIWLFAFLCRIFNKKVIFWTHGLKGQDKGFKKFIRKLFFKYLPDGILLYGHYQEKIMIAERFNPKKLFVIYNSLLSSVQFEILKKIPFNESQIEKQQIFKNKDAFTLIFIGRLVEAKGIAEILKASKKLKERGLITNCIFIGDGPAEQSLQFFCEENGLIDNIFFAGCIYNEQEIAKYFSMSDLMISPGNVGLNCIHSLGYGVPVMTHDNFIYQNPEVEAIAEDQTGVFYKYNDFENMVDKLESWIRKEKNKHNISLQCQEIIRKIYNPDYHANRIVHAIKQILENEN